MFAFLASCAIVALFAMLSDTRRRLKRTEATLAEMAMRIVTLPHRSAKAAGRDDVAEPVGSPSPWSPATEPAPEPAVNAPPAPSLPPVAPNLRPSHPSPAEPDTILATPLAEQAEPPIASPAPRRLVFRFEEFFGRQLPIWAGGITLAIAGVLIVRYAVDAGLFKRIFTHGVQIAAGLLFGAGLIGGAELAYRHQARLRDVRVPQALSGAGVATLYATILVATNAYGLIGPLAAFMCLAFITVLALGLSLRFGAASAVLGLVGGLAAPALVGSAAPNLPLLAIYLGLTIAGLAGVSRKQRWPWLALAALVGGAGWSLWMVLASSAMDVMGSLSVGGFVLLLAIALPSLAPQGPRSLVSRSASAIVGALQLALLVAHGGFAPLHWGLFGLLALAGQWLAGRNAGFALVPSVSLVLAVLLLGIWPHPVVFWFVVIGLAMVAIHALPLLARLWQATGGEQRAVELSLLALAVPALTTWHFDAVSHGHLALISAASSLLCASGLALGWNAARGADKRFALLATGCGILLALALGLAVPLWLVPLAIATVAAAMLVFAQLAADIRIERVACGFAFAALLGLIATLPDMRELQNLLAGPPAGVAAHGTLRWAGMAALALFFVLRVGTPTLQAGAQIAAGLLAYGTLAQMVPGVWLPLVPSLGGAALVVAGRRLDWARSAYAAVSLGAVAVGWAFVPLMLWLAPALESLVGRPMVLDPALDLATVLKRLAVPALASGGALWAARKQMPEAMRRWGLVATAGLGGIALHALYRIGFAHGFGTDFVHTGLGERLLWEALLVGGGWQLLHSGRPVLTNGLGSGLAGAGSVHALWYTLLLYNPLWAAQAVGPWPLMNLVAPAFALLPVGFVVLRRRFLTAPRWLTSAAQMGAMVLIAAFAWASLRQIFHGTLLTLPGVAPVENILRSLLLLALAIGYLLWGIRQHRHDWRIASLVLMLGAVGKVFLFDASGLDGLLRIASFVALGFSLIGIGWLYSRQLAQLTPPQSDC